MRLLRILSYYSTYIVVAGLTKGEIAALPVEEYQGSVQTPAFFV